MACKYLGRVKDIIIVPLLHDTPGELGNRSGPNIVIVERDYCDVYHRMITLGPLVKDSIGAKGITWSAKEEYEEVGKLNGTDEHGHPLLIKDHQVAEAILHLSSTTNGEASYKAYKALSERVGIDLTHIAEDQREVVIHFNDLSYQPRRVLRTPIWSGKESEERPYTPYALNVEDLVPWRTLTGRQHVYLDHEWIIEFGEQLPTYKLLSFKHPSITVKDRASTVNT